MKKLVRLLSASCLALCCSAVFASQVGTTWHNVIVFGDSLSDVGNNDWVPITDSQKKTVLTGAPITSSPRHLWVDSLVAQLPLDVPLAKNIFPAKDQRVASNPNDYNADYAYASAESGKQYLDDMSPNAYPPYEPQCTAAGKGCVPGVELQVAQYLKAVGTPDPRSLIIIWSGGNDVFDNISKLISKSPSLTQSPNHFISTVMNDTFNTQAKQYSHPVTEIHDAVVALENKGVQPAQIYVMNLPNLAATPAARAMASQYKNLSGLILWAVKMVSGLYNFSLQSTLSPVLPSSHIVDVSSLFKDMIANKAKYGFTNVTDSCVAAGVYAKDPGCSGYLFFNGKHPTANVEDIFAKYLLNNYLKK